SAAATVNLADCEDSASAPPSAPGPSAAPGTPALDARLLMPSPAVPRDLQGLGKNGQSILAARAHVLEILATDNACTAWFRQGTANPAKAFQTLSFQLDSKTPGYVVERLNGTAPEAYLSPYVATVIQDGGEYQAVTINAEGAFFRPAAGVV